MTYSSSSPSPAPVPKWSANTSARYEVDSTTCRTPAPAIRLSRWVRNGTPAVGSIGLGALRVSGRNRVP